MRSVRLRVISSKLLPFSCLNVCMCLLACLLACFMTMIQLDAEQLRKQKRTACCVENQLQAPAADILNHFHFSALECLSQICHLAVFLVLVCVLLHKI